MYVICTLLKIAGCRLVLKFLKLGYLIKKISIYLRIAKVTSAYRIYFIVYQMKRVFE
jgi:hypothetical protein